MPLQLLPIIIEDRLAPEVQEAQHRRKVRPILPSGRYDSDVGLRSAPSRRTHHETANHHPELPHTVLSNHPLGLPRRGGRPRGQPQLHGRAPATPGLRVSGRDPSPRPGISRFGRLQHLSVQLREGAVHRAQVRWWMSPGRQALPSRLPRAAQRADLSLRCGQALLPGSWPKPTDEQALQPTDEQAR